MTTSQIITIAGQMLDDTAETYHTVALKLQWVNLGQREWIAKTGEYTNTSTITTVASTPTYAIPTTFTRLHGLKRARWLDTSGRYIPLTQATLSEVDDWITNGNISTGGTPQYYYVTEDKPQVIGMYPTKAGTSKLYIDWVGMPTSMTVTSTPAISPEAHEALIDYVVYMGKLREEKEGVAQMYYNRFIEKTEEAKTDLFKSPDLLEINPETLGD